MSEGINNPDPTLGAALGRVASGLYVCSCGRGDDSSPFIASWVQQVAMEPPCVCIAIEDARSALAALDGQDGALTLSILPEDGGDALMSPFFKKAEQDDAFRGLTTARAPNDGVYLADALAWLECQELSRMRAGGHHVVIAKVLAGGVLREGRPRIHVRKTGFSY